MASKGGKQRELQKLCEEIVAKLESCDVGRDVAKQLDQCITFYGKWPSMLQIDKCIPPDVETE